MLGPPRVDEISPPCRERIKVPALEESRVGSLEGSGAAPGVSAGSKVPAPWEIACGLLERGRAEARGASGCALLLARSGGSLLRSRVGEIGRASCREKGLMPLGRGSGTTNAGASAR